MKFDWFPASITDYIDGEGDWSGWSPCSVSCGNGNQKRTRSCGYACTATESRTCDMPSCPGKTVLPWTILYSRKLLYLIYKVAYAAKGQYETLMALSYVQGLKMLSRQQRQKSVCLLALKSLMQQSSSELVSYFVT